MDSTPPLLIHGMHGLGDCIHQRAIVRTFLDAGCDVSLETSWPCIYSDLPVTCIRRPVALRTQLKNAEREANKFAPGPAPHHHPRSVRVSYSRGTVADGTILSAMFKSAGIPAAYATADFSLPVPAAWHDDYNLKVIFEAAGYKPILIYRPLTARPEWRGGQVRNANADDYAAVFAAIRDSFFVVSLADLVPGREWIVGPRLKPDVTLHAGELSFEAMAALFKRARLVFTSSGFAAILAPAVGTACISIQGGYEPASWHADGAKLAPWLGIDTIKPCSCATSGCAQPCTKKLDVPAAVDRVHAFLVNHCGATPPAPRPISEMFDAPEHVEPLRIRAHTLRTLDPRLIRGNPLQRAVRTGPMKA